ncbi:MAG: Hsp70 family protein [Francisellaceae bacterium]
MFQQKVVITIPASFEPAARDLTAEAARLCDFEQLTLLEEPQASLYGWINNKGDSWRDELKAGDIILVVDIGGGTTDFSLIAVEDEEGQLGFKRIAVGDHILIGGDNIDLMLAMEIQQRFIKKDAPLEAWQVQALVHACRDAKEKLLSDTELKDIAVVIPGRSSKLFGKTVKETLSRIDIEKIVLSGFFPSVNIDEKPKQNLRTGISRLSLNYAQDAAITRHLAAFLSKQAQHGEGFIAPKAVLFNGGVLKSDTLRQHIMNSVNKWLVEADKEEAIELGGADYDTSVSFGASVFADSLNGNGIRIRGGSSHSFYIGIESPMPAIPGFEPPIEALCIAPQGMENGESQTYEAEAFSLVVGEPVEFRFFAANSRMDDQLGDIIEDWQNADLSELQPLRLTLSADNYKNGEMVPVYISTMHTEIGTLEVTARAVESADNWKLEFETIR